MPRDYGYGNTGRTPDYNMLLQALLEQERNQGATGESPSGIATNAYLGSIPLTGEQGREARMLGEADRRYFQNREDERKRFGDIADAQSQASVRGFERRTGVAEEQGPMRTIRRFGSSGEFTDPDAARGAQERAMDDPRVISAGINADGRSELANAKNALKDSEAVSKAAEDENTRHELIRLATEVRNHPALNRSVGAFDTLNPLTITSGGRDFKAKTDRLRNLLALENRSKLKGQGAVSDFEGRMLSSAGTALDTGMDEDSFRAELDRIIGDTQRKGNAPSGVKRYNPATGRIE
jgi:hypothetical protein